MIDLQALLATVTGFVAGLGFVPMALGATVLLCGGVPVLALLTGLTAVAGMAGLIAATVGLYGSCAVIFFVVRALRRPTAVGPAFFVLFIGAAIVPFWLFMVLASARGSRFIHTVAAVAVVSTPNLVIFALSVVLETRIAVSPFLLSLGAASLAVAIGALLRRLLKGRHEDFSPAAGIQRG